MCVNSVGTKGLSVTPARNKDAGICELLFGLPIKRMQTDYP
jgi:hypothetical protein